MKPATYKLTLTASTDTEPLEEWEVIYHSDLYIDSDFPDYCDVVNLVLQHNADRRVAYEAAKADDEVARRQEREHERD